MHPIDRRDKLADPAFHGWGRAGVDFGTGVYRSDTIKSSAAAGCSGTTQTPHICMALLACDINLGLCTCICFSDEAAVNGTDLVLNDIEWEVRRKTLIARHSERNGEAVYIFGVCLQDMPNGGVETVFFDI